MTRLVALDPTVPGAKQTTPMKSMNMRVLFLFAQIDTNGPCPAKETEILTGTLEFHC